MANPNSFLTLLRRCIVKVVEPKPDPGEGWCMDCDLAKGRTVVFPADGIIQHVNKHSGDSQPNVTVRWPSTSKGVNL